MDLALYDPDCGYYARAAQRSGRAGDFFTSVDVGPIFGELLEIQIAEMLRIVESLGTDPDTSPIPNPHCHLDLVEAGAGNGRLSADVLGAMRARDRAIYESARLHLVEASAEARAAQRSTLGDLGARLASSGAVLPPSFEGVLLANELIDAMPVHQVVMDEDVLREVYVAARLTADGWRLTTVEGPLSTPRLAEYLDALGVTLQPGWRAEINLDAVDWIRDAARRLRRGFIILIDYGHDARELYSASHSTGTLTTFSAHVSAGAESDAPPWLLDAGRRDITAHVDFTSVRAAAEAEGMLTIGFLDQTYFLMGLLPLLDHPPPSAVPSTGAWSSERADGRNRQLKTLLLPGGLGSTHKVLILGKNVGAPALLGCSYRLRVT